jgi:cytochrome c
MGGREGGKIAAGIAGALLLVAASNWMSGAIYKVNYLERPAYRISEAPAAPTVDLQALRRNWPQALGSPESRVQLLSYMRNMPREVAGPTPASLAVPAAAPEPPLDLATRMARADVMRGERSSRKCAACHTFETGGPNRVGPNLHGVVGRNIAASDGFSYSPVMIAAPGNWTAEELDSFLEKPAATMPGTRMGFIGLPNQQERADLIAYLGTLR